MHYVAPFKGFDTQTKRGGLDDAREALAKFKSIVAGGTLPNSRLLTVYEMDLSEYRPGGKGGFWSMVKNVVDREGRGPEARGDLLSAGAKAV